MPMAIKSDTLSSSRYRPWMRHWLLAAGVYNLVWGASVVLAPDAPLRLFGVDALSGTGRAIWQCLGMVIGVYGIGYLAASLDPLRHWPIVLVGFLGKIFGPIGFVWCASQGDIDWRFGLTIPTNDLLWWIPFGLMLQGAWLHAREFDVGGTRVEPTRARIECEPLLGTPTSSTPDLGVALLVARNQHGVSLAALSQSKPVLLVALRHFGCTFCRQTLADIAAQRARLEAEGTQIAILHSADVSSAAPILARAGLGDISSFADPDHLLSRSLGIERGSFMAVLGPRNILKAIPALLSGHGIGYPVGDPLQMPASFVVHKGRVLSHHHHTYAGEREDFPGLLKTAGLASGAIPAHT